MFFKKKLFSILTIIECVFAAAVLLILIISIAYNARKAKEDAASSAAAETEARTEKAAETRENEGATDEGSGSIFDPVNPSENATSSQTDTQTDTKTDTPDDKETDPPTEAPTKAPTEAPTLPNVTRMLTDVVFVGDSRTAGLGSNGSVSYGILSDDCICAVWGGQLTDATAKQITLIAANKKRDAAIFWYGVNDVQVNPDRDNAAAFIENYEAVIHLYTTMAPGSDVYIMSVLTTGKEEHDYYADQDKNIAKYNEALREYCIEKGYYYIDLTALPLTEDDFCEDHIHFTRNWYQKVFLPYVLPLLGIPI